MLFRSVERAIDILAAEAKEGAIDQALLDAFVGANVFALVTPETGKVRVVTPH